MQLKTILYIRTDICPEEIKIGGSVTHTLGVINGFLKLGIKVICASAAMPTLLKKINIEKFIHLKMYPLFFFLRWKFNFVRWQLESLFSSIVFAFQIRRLFKEYSFDAIYQRYSILNCTGIFLSRWYTTPLILEYNGSEVWAYKAWGEKSYFSIYWIAKLIEKYNIIHAHSIIVVSEVLKDDLIKKGINASKILVNPNSVDEQIFDATKLDTERLIIRTLHNIQRKFVYGFVGTFSYWHGIESIAQAIKVLATENTPLHFILIGDGPLKPSIEKQLLSNPLTASMITFTQKVNFEEIPAYLAACDAFLCPTQPNKDGSRFFGSPTKLFEYLSMGKPIIATRLEQLIDIIMPTMSLEKKSSTYSCITNQVGILIDPTNTEELVKAIEVVANMNEHHRNIMGNNARKRVVEHYTWTHHTLNIKNFVEKTLNL